MVTIAKGCFDNPFGSFYVGGQLFIIRVQHVMYNQIFSSGFNISLYQVE